MQAIYYQYWSGRYFGTASAVVNPINWGDFGLYKLYALLLILLLAASFFDVLYQLFKNHVSQLKTSALAALLLCLYLMQLPSVVEGLFWLPGTLTYQLPNMLLLLVLALLLRLFRTGNTTHKTIFTGLAAVCCIAAIGSNEMSLVMAFTTVLYITYLNRLNTTYRPYLLFLLAVCVAACLVAVLAPGNYTRMGEQASSSRPLWSVVYAAFLTALSFYRWLPPLLVVSVLYALHWGLPLADQAKGNRMFKADLRLALLYFLATLFLMHFTFTWAVGERPTPRVENVIYLFFVMGWFYLVQVALARYGHLLQSERKLSPALPVAMACLFLLQVSDINGNVATAYIDLVSGKAAAYDSALQERESYLATSGCDTCLLSPLPAIPQSLFLMDVEAGENSSFWVNKDTAEYWGKASIYLTAPDPEVKDNLTTLREAGKQQLTD